MSEQNNFDTREIINAGLITAAVAVSISVIGMVELFANRDLIAGIITVGQVWVFAPIIYMVYYKLNQLNIESSGKQFQIGAIIGAITGVSLALVIILQEAFNIRQFFINVSPSLIEVLGFGQTGFVGSLVIFLASTAVGLLTAGFLMLPPRWKSALFAGLAWTFGIGLFSDVLSERLRTFFGSNVARAIFVSKAIQPGVALVVFIVVTGIAYQWRAGKTAVSHRISGFTPKQQGNFRWVQIGFGIVVMLILPQILGTYLSEVTNNIGLFILMGLGLNIVVGFAGLLDLGYVAFFALGAYVIGILTSTGSLGIAGMNFWVALPIAVVVSTLAGLTLGTPVLRMRGDYLAIVTLGFGEIIRVLALSDVLKPYIGGAQGIIQIPKPAIAGVPLIKPEQLYYVILIAVLLAVFISWRLRDSRLGRQWMAMREDEDVAEAMGINLISTKLLAFAIGAAFSGLSGAIFAGKLTSIFPHSFNLLISINVLSLIIVGGVGSLPGVAIGSLVLVGLPEILREFAEFRLLMYGVVLVVMMLAKPEGLWPSEATRRELGRDNDDGVPDDIETLATAQN